MMILLFTLFLLSPTLAYFLKHCTIDYKSVSVDCRYSGLHRIPDDIPGYVKGLTLMDNNIQKINSTDILHLSNLTMLDLTSNLITHVDDGTFVPLVQLKELRMDDNLLTTLTDNMFQGLSNLSILSLAYNNIQFVDSSAFKLLPNLQTLSMTPNQITDMITILQLPRLHMLSIVSEKLESFQSKDLPFNMTSELRELIVNSESIKKFSITTAAFPHLETIDLSRCFADEWDIPDKYFLRNITKVSFTCGFTFNSIRKALQSLDSLAYLQLSIMDDWIEGGLLNIACKIPTLRTLDLYYSITNLTEKLSPCTQLINLDLSDNDLTELSKGSIQQMKQLSHLNLKKNMLSKVPDDVKHLSMLQILDLRSNHINDLSCSDFLNLTKLTHLHLDNNDINKLQQCAFRHLNELKALTLHDNSIWMIGETFRIGLQKLELLDLTSNTVPGLSQWDFINLKSLKQLDLGLGQVYMSQKPNHTLKRLKTFTIQFSKRNDPFKFKFISNFVSAMNNLEHITAENVDSDSDLPHSPHRDTFKDVPQLKSLTLRSSNLSDLDPELFYPIQNLESADLSNSKLKSLDFLAQANLTRVSWLDLSQNELAVINVSVFSFLPALRYVNMGLNPFACDCSNSDFQQWVLNNSQTLVVDAHRYTCAYPLDKKGTRFLDFDYHSCLVDASFICFVSSTCVIVLTLLTSFTYHFLRLHLLYGYYLFLAFLYDATQRKRGSPQRYDAFISYNVHDELWVYREMLPVLEGEQGWRLCLHHRDFPPGKPIIENITDAIYGSRKTICVISHHYLESEWCSREIQMARPKKLTTLTDNMFQGLSNLSILSLAYNNIQFVDSSAFKLLPNLQTLSMTPNQITDMITILQLPRLHMLSIVSEKLESFQSKDLPFNMTSELRELIVNSESIKKFSITTAAFPHLETIDLSRCFADEWDIPDKYFLRNITKVSFTCGFTFNSIRKALQSLDSLAYLQLSIMDDWIEGGLLNIACKIPTLRTLDLYYSITNLTEKLSPCTQLINLDLSDNDLTELSKGSIQQMKQLSHLNLKKNMLSKVPDDVKHLSMLQILDLRSNHINDLSCSDFLNLTKLTHLHLDNNDINKLQQCAFRHLNELKALTLHDNSIWMIGETFRIGLQKLELLDLTSNTVPGLSQWDFINLKSLKQLDLGLGQVYMSQKPNHTLKRLKTFTIQFSKRNDPFKFKFISNFVSAMNNLEHITAENVDSDSDLPHSPHRDTFKDVPQLKSLTLRSSNLSDLDPELFYPIQNLESADLSNSKLKSLDFLAQANLTRVSWLDLSQNELAVINVSVFSFLPALRYVNMGLNPFACDCSNSDFQQWVLNNSQTLVVDAHRYTCAYPLDKKGTRFLDFDYHSCLVDASFICFVSSTCVIVLTLLTSFTYHFLRLHLLYGYYLFLAFLYDATQRKRGSPQRYDAFISYNVHDELWVYREMLPVLEGEQGWRLCLHHRDFPPGKPIIENITDAIYGSRKTICVISHHYLESEWCSREIQMASYRLFDEQKDILILVFLEDIPAHQLSPYYHMKKLVKRQTYLSWPQAGQHPGLFWQNLRRAMEADTDLRLNI